VTVADLYPTEPERSKLRGPRDRWQPLRAGLLNVWQYEDETFQFENGRLVLYGPNGSGKTMALELLFPYLLDANATPARLSTAGGNDRGGLWSRVSGYEDVNGQVGYLWAEFARDTEPEPEYFTCGTRLEVRRSGGRQAWFTTNSRVGGDLSLLDSQRVPLTLQALRERIGGAGGKVWGDDVAGYKAAVRTTLYPGFSADRYQALIDGLLAVRKQSITDGLTDRRLNELLTDGLPALDTHELDQVARGFEQLDSRRDTIEELEAAVKAAESLDRRVKIYARGAVRSAAALVSAAQTQHENVTRERNANQQTLSDAAEAITDAKGKAEKAEDREGELTGRAEAIRASAQYKNIDELGAREQTASRSKTEAERAAEQAKRFAESAKGAEERAGTDEKAAAEAAARATETAREIAVQARRASLDVTPDEDLTRIAAAYQNEIEIKQEAVSEVRTKLGAVAMATQRRADAEAEQHRADEGLKEGERKLRVATEELTRSGQRWVSDVGSWTDGLTEMAMNPTDLATATADIRLDMFRGVADSALQRALLTITRALDEIARRHGEIVAAKSELEVERASLEAGGTTLIPSAPPWRDRDPHRQGAPLWQLVDVSSDDVDLAGLEASLHAAGVLDLFIPVEAEPSVTGDTTARRAEHTVGPSLARVLRVDPEAVAEVGVDPDRVTAVLRSVAFTGTGTDALTVRDDGTFAYGPIMGTNPSNQARYIGATARERARMARILELTDEIATLSRQLSGLEADQHGNEARIELAESERRAAPSGQQVREAREALNNAETRMELAKGTVEAADAAYGQADQGVRLTLMELNRTASQFGLPTAEGDLDRLAATLKRLFRQAGNLATEAAVASSAHAASERSARLAGEQRNEAERQQKLSREAEGQARQDKAAFDQLYASVGAGAKKAASDLAAVARKLDDAGKERKRLQTLLEDLAKAQGQAETALAASEREAAQAEGTRDAAGETFRAVTDAGIATDAGLDLDSATLTNVTSILHAARAVNRVVPDEPDAHRLASQLHQLEEERYRAQTALNAKADITLTDVQGTGEQLQVSRTFATVEGIDMRIADLVERFSTELDRARRELEAKETELFEQTLTGSLRAHLASRLRAAQGLVDGMNDLLAGIRTASGGVAVSLRWDVHDGVEDRDTLSRIKSLLLRDHHTEDERAALFDFLTRRIDLVRSDDRSTGHWRDALEELFDYRRWHTFQLIVRHDRFGDRAMAFNSRKVSLSAGEKSLVLSLPLFAAIASHYMPRDSDGDPPGCPRLLLLDEVFPKNDRPNKRQILRLLTDLDLDCVLTSDKDMCDYDTVDGIAIAVISKDGDASFATRLVWNGTETIPQPPSLGR